MFAPLLEQIGLELEALNIPYMLIGGQAVLLYGEPRLTRNIDVTLGAGPERLEAILRFANRLGWEVLVEAPADFVQKTMVLPCQDPTSGIRVDFIFSNSVYEQQAMQRVRRVPIGKAQVRFASLEDVIIHKIVAGRPRDLEDVRSVLLKNSQFDRAYIRKWLGEFDRGLNENFTERFENVLKSLP